MKRLLLVASLGLLSLASAQSARAQSTTRAAEDNPWFTTEAPAAAGAPAAYPTGWMSAPGISLNLHTRPSTDYNGRPLKQKTSRRKPAAPVEDAPAYTTGWMSAPGMSLSLHTRPSTDYNGRLLKPVARRQAASSLSAAPTGPDGRVAVYVPRHK